jgi:two-component system, LytTR family, response regulator LytT
MLNAVIIEDERPALENLIATLSSIAGDVHITARLSSVRESIEYLSQKPAVDLIFSDVQLSDGLSFEIFNQGNVRTPVIFITAMMNL